MIPQKIKIFNDESIEVEASAPLIISASRATDIPAFYTDWFFNRLDKGYVKWRNPFNGVDSYVSFANTRFIVFWSKNPSQLIPHLHILKERGIDCYIQYTLNDYEDVGYEPNVLNLKLRIETFKELVRILGKGSVVWRFDPLILTDNIGIEDLLGRIERIGDELHGYTEKLVFSFADIDSYRKVESNLRRYGIQYMEWDESTMREFASRISDLNRSKGWNVRLATCAEKIDLSEYGIKHNKCIDDELIARIAWKDNVLMNHFGMDVRTVQPDLFGNIEFPSDAIILSENRYAVRTQRSKDGGQRKLCGCVASKDIGQYNTCPHGCIYCYANNSPDIAMRNNQNHNPNKDTITC